MDQFCGTFRRGLAGLEDFLVRQRCFANAGGGVGDAGKGGHPKAALTGNDCFGNGAHANGIRAKCGEGANFSGGFVAGAADRAIHSMAQSDLGGACGVADLFGEIGVIGLCKIHKSVQIFPQWTAQWVVAH